jgi:hypothetical protein
MLYVYHSLLYYCKTNCYKCYYINCDGKWWTLLGAVNNTFLPTFGQTEPGLFSCPWAVGVHACWCVCLCAPLSGCSPFTLWVCVFEWVGGREGAGDLFFVPHCRISPSPMLLPSNWPFLAPFFNYPRYICLYWQKHPFPIPSSYIQEPITQSWWFFFQSAANQPFVSLDSSLGASYLHCIF